MGIELCHGWHHLVITAQNIAMDMKKKQIRGPPKHHALLDDIDLVFLAE